MDILGFFLAYVLYSEDPRGNFPKAVWHWAAKVCRKFFFLKILSDYVAFSLVFRSMQN
jgi:hypothetical protein